MDLLCAGRQQIAKNQTNVKSYVVQIFKFINDEINEQLQSDSKVSVRNQKIDDFLIPGSDLRCLLTRENLNSEFSA